ncbi:MAG TPA: glycoside hydrolase family 130 protein [Flavitalea sp.]|nr:glycoside hydrolase family 130 protein [Flavitalea sp.]
MPVNVIRKNILFEPDSSRVIARLLYTSKERSIDLINRITALSPKEQHEAMTQVLRDYSKRHRSISKVFEKHFHKMVSLLGKDNIDPKSFTTNQKVLIGSYFTMEYSIEAAAFFNPSIVDDPDQSGLARNEKRVIISFRATGEGHVSSIVFRSGIIDSANNIQIEQPGKMLESPEHVKSHTYHKKSFRQKLEEMQDCSSPAYSMMMEKLGDAFTYEELKKDVEETIREVHDTGSLVLLKEMMWLASSHYEMDFSVDTSISERVIFPIAETEQKGIEDARFVKFSDDDGEVTYYATYTAYDGITILPKLLQTKDFYHFKVLPIHGDVAQNKGMALFPRKIKGKYVMLCRIDGVNNYISFSDNINVWRKANILQTPKFPWEFVQMGNCGSPIETPDGWIIITHGVGPVREYVLGVSLLDLENPEIVIGRLEHPLIVPNEREREGYVPNVVYSCGAMIHDGNLFIPYAMSDYASTYATVNLEELMTALKNSKVTA